MDYAKKKSFSSKVFRVHAKCLRTGRTELAKRIRDKYEQYFPKDDMATAAGWALIASRTLL